MEDDVLLITRGAAYTEFNGQPFVPPLTVEKDDTVVVLGATSSRSARVAVYGADRALRDERGLVRGQWLRVTRSMP